jgi:predicted dehydrogenase
MLFGTVISNSMKIRLGMIGGGTGSFIGAVHRKAAAIDGHFDLISGSFSSDAQISRQTGAELDLDPQRVYDTFTQMLDTEAALPAERRIQAVAVVTPNHLHAGPTILALNHGFDVILDKPMAFSLQEAQQIKSALQQSGRLLALTHTYAGYPMVKEARHLIAQGKLGQIHKIYVEYPQGWLSRFIEHDGQKQAGWRTDPTRAGAGGCIGDIGTHAAHLAEYVSGLRITQLCAELNTRVSGRLLDDDSAALLRFENGATGVLIATQVAAGEENNVRIRIYGEHGGLEWAHQDANTLQVKMLDQPVQLYRAGAGYLSQAALSNTRLPPGHPEGYIEAFANIYSSFARAVNDCRSGNFTRLQDYDFPSADEGLRGMAFIDAMLASSTSAEKWTAIDS